MSHAQFTPTRKQKRTLNNLYWDLSPRSKPTNWKGKWASDHSWDLEERLALVLEQDGSAKPYAEQPYNETLAERIQVQLLPASSTDEKYALFRKYQAHVHREPEAEISSRSGWEQFLKIEAGDDHLNFGTFHQEYRCTPLSTDPDRGKLIAVGVLDLLPSCVSSVYLFYDPQFKHWELGKISALNEIALAKRLHRDAHSSVQWYYMGYYIHTCTKMRYKATYMPSEILDTTNNAWVAYSDIVEQLDLGYRHSFHGAAPPPVLLPVTIEDGELPRPLPPGMEDPDQVMQHENEFKIFAMAAGRPTLQPLAVPAQARGPILACCAALGDLAKDIAVL